MIKQLKVKFICINMAIVTVMLLMIFGTVLHFTRQNLQNQSLQAMEQAANNRPRPGRPGEIPDHVLLPFFTVTIGKDGSITPAHSEFFDLSDDALLQELVDIAGNSPGRNGLLSKYKLRFCRFPTPQGQKIIFLDISSEMETVQQLLHTCLIIGIISFATFWGISILLANWAIRPVEEAWNQQKQFVADASHELKTPLTVITTNAELLQEQSYTPEERQQFSRHILTVSRQMRNLVESLLELARADNGTNQMVFVPLDLSQLVRETLLLFEPVYFEAGLQLQSDIEPNLVVSGSDTHLRQILEILLDNGIKYADPESTIMITLHRQGNRCLLCASTVGDAISREDLKRIFQRFYRIDQARSRNGSCGLGLSIAKTITDAHGGRIWAESEHGINRFFVRLNLLR